jgi:hypothetical protein
VESLCVSLRSNQTNCDQIQFWQPSQINQNLIGSFNLNNIPSEQWTLVKSISCPSSLIQLSVPKCALSFRDLNDTSRANTISFYLMACYQNGTIGFIESQSYAQTFTGAIPIKAGCVGGGSSDWNKTQWQSIDSELASLTDTSKRLRFSQEHIVTIDESHTGSIGVGITNFCRLVVFRQCAGLKESHANANSAISNMVNLYEYCMLSGVDCWDLVMNTNPKLVDSIIDQLEAKFNGQTHTMQRTYFSRHYGILYLLYRISSSCSSSNSTSFRSMDMLVKLLLNRCMAIICFSVQYAISVESLLGPTAGTASVTPINTSMIVAASVDNSGKLV